MSATWTGASTSITGGSIYNSSDNFTITVDGTSISTLNVANLEELEKKLKEIEDELAEIALLYDLPERKSVYDMSYEEYMELPGSVRL